MHAQSYSKKLSPLSPLAKKAVFSGCWRVTGFSRVVTKLSPTGCKQLVALRKSQNESCHPLSASKEGGGLDLIETEMPKSIDDCAHLRGLTPICPWARCRYSLLVDIRHPKTPSRMKAVERYPGDEPVYGPTCAIAVARERFDGMELEEIATHFGFTRQMVQQVIEGALGKLARNKELQRIHADGFGG